MRAYLILLQVFYAVLFVPWWYALTIAPTMFNHGATSWAVHTSTAIVTYPLSVVACSLLSWIQFHRWPRAVRWIILVPMLWPAAALTVFLSIRA
ncbi:MAG: hypothetical protein OWQ59_01245 [Alicyclobacillaceae bacterium]|jgi:hypothetical protein|uniref:hypothetical protein n=1 Tax=Alicyclobacillus sp. SP_1 TaxID=2942475 RepID=UPI0021570E6D|nr:hypothetical protein [Alicyclobacillus sp. SP_1]MCY0887064.1 hypothetical protein [Alicyclobacillaceae bacterium]MCY0896175.1 hypothetical protein [Alicyclobacillaceae bacterium]